MRRTKLETEHQRSKLPYWGCLMVLSFACLLIAPFLIPHDPYLVNMSAKLQPPSTAYLLGTDGLGRDVLSRLIFGGRNTVGTSLVIVFLALGIGVPAGLLSGYAGGWTDRLFMRVSDSLLAFPDYMIAIVLSGLLGPGIINLIIAMISVKWIAYARVIRNSVLSEKHKDYISLAQLNGLSPFRIIIKHLIPHALSHVIVIATLDMGKIILMIASLSYIGLGVQPPIPEWGAMLNESRAHFHSSPYLMLAPGLLIILFVLLSNVLGDQLRDRLDVKKKRWG